VDDRVRVPAVSLDVLRGHEGNEGWEGGGRVCRAYTEREGGIGCTVTESGIEMHLRTV